MPVFRPFLVEPGPLPLVTPKAIPVAYFLAEPKALPYPPRRHDALRYLLGTSGLSPEKYTITLHSKTSLPGESRAGLLTARVLWIEVIDRTIILQTRNKPERFDGAWAVFPDGPPPRDEDPPLGSLTLPTWEPLRLGPRFHLRGLNGTGIVLAAPEYGPTPALVCRTNGELKVITATEEARRHTPTAAPPPR